MRVRLRLTKAGKRSSGFIGLDERKFGGEQLRNFVLMIDSSRSGRFRRNTICLSLTADNSLVAAISARPQVAFDAQRRKLATASRGAIAEQQTVAQHGVAGEHPMSRRS